MRKIGRFLLMLAHVLVCQFSFGQTNFESEADLIKQANKFFNAGDFQSCQSLFSQLLSNHPNDADYLFKFGACLLHNETDKERSLKYLEGACKTPTVDARAIYYLAKNQHLLYRFDEAIRTLDQYKAKLAPGQPDPLNAAWLQERCRRAKMFYLPGQQFKPLSANESLEGEFYRQFDLSSIKARVIPVPQNFKSELDIKRNFNTFMVVGPEFQTVYYASFGEKDMTGKDIYCRKKLPIGEWGLPILLDNAVNSPYDEDFPFYSEKSKTLYFTSNSGSSMGGNDIFKSFYDEEKASFSAPINMEYPINSPDEDFFYVTDLMEDFAWFASKRESKPGSTKVYKIQSPENLKNQVFIQGEYNNLKDTTKKRISIRVFEKATGELLGVYNSNALNGKYIVVLPAGKELTLSYEPAGAAPQAFDLASNNAMANMTFKQKIQFEQDETGEKIKVVDDKGLVPNNSEKVGFLNKEQALSLLLDRRENPGKYLGSAYSDLSVTAALGKPSTPNAASKQKEAELALEKQKKEEEIKRAAGEEAVKLEIARVAREKAKADSLQQAKQLALEKAKQALKEESEKIAREKAKSDSIQKSQQLALEKAKAEEAKKKAEAANLAKEKAKSDSIQKSQQLALEKAKAEEAKKKAEAAKLAKEKAKSDSIQKSQQLALEKAKAEEAKKKAEAAKLAKEKAKSDSIQKSQQLALEKAKAEEAKKKAEAAKLAKEKAKSDSIQKSQQLALEKAKAEEAKKNAEAAKLAKEKAKSDSIQKSQQLALEKAKAEEAKKKAEAAKLAKENAKSDSIQKSQQLALEKAKKEAEKTAKETEMLNRERALNDSVRREKQLAFEKNFREEARKKRQADSIAKNSLLAMNRAKTDSIQRAKDMALEKSNAMEDKKKAENDRLANAKAEIDRLAKIKAKNDSVEKAQKLNVEKNKANAEEAKRKAEAGKLAKENVKLDSLRKANQMAIEKAKAEEALLSAEAERILRERAQADSLKKAKLLVLEKSTKEEEQKRKTEATRVTKELAQSDSLKMVQELAMEKAKAEAEKKLNPSQKDPTTLELERQKEEAIRLGLVRPNKMKDSLLTEAREIARLKDAELKRKIEDDKKAIAENAKNAPEPIEVIKKASEPDKASLAQEFELAERNAREKEKQMSQLEKTQKVVQQKNNAIDYKGLPEERIKELHDLSKRNAQAISNQSLIQQIKAKAVLGQTIIVTEDELAKLRAEKEKEIFNSLVLIAQEEELSRRIESGDKSAIQELADLKAGKSKAIVEDKNPNAEKLKEGAEKRAKEEAEAIAKAKEAKLLAEIQKRKEDKAKESSQEEAKSEVERLAVEKVKAEEAKKAAENNRLAEEKAKAEANRLAAEKAKAEEAKKAAENNRLAEEKAKAEVTRLAAEKAKAEEAKKAAENNRLAEDKAKADATRLAAEKAKAEEAKKAAENTRLAEEKAKAEATRLAEAKAKEEAAIKKAETERLAAEKTKAEEAKKMADAAKAVAQKENIEKAKSVDYDQLTKDSLAKWNYLKLADYIRTQAKGKPVVIDSAKVLATRTELEGKIKAHFFNQSKEWAKVSPAKKELSSKVDAKPIESVAIKDKSELKAEEQARKDKIEKEQARQAQEDLKKLSELAKATQELTNEAKRTVNTSKDDRKKRELLMRIAAEAKARELIATRIEEQTGVKRDEANKNFNAVAGILSQIDTNNSNVSLVRQTMNKIGKLSEKANEDFAFIDSISAIPRNKEVMAHITKSEKYEITKQLSDSTDLFQAEDIMYRVEMVLFESKLPEEVLPYLDKIIVESDAHGNLNLTTGWFLNYADAWRLTRELGWKGLNQATILAFHKGEPITVEEAKKIVLKSQKKKP